MASIEENYAKVCATPGDIWEHLPTIKRYAEQSESIVEMGVRYIVSTWALLAGKPKWMISIDIEDPKAFGADIFEVYDATLDAGIEFSFIKGSSLEIDPPERDLLFVDTLHTYPQLSAELAKHHAKTKKFILMHDTNLDGDTEMRRAVNEFLEQHAEWALAEQFDNCNGLTVLKRV